MNIRNYKKKALSMLSFLLCITNTYAQNGAGGINEATRMVTSYFDPATRLTYAIGAVVGLIGSVKVYNKFSSGNSDTSKIIPFEVLDKVFTPPPIHNDYWKSIEEEEGLKSNISVEHDQGFSTGISLGELGKISTLLKQEELTNETLSVAVKIADTELLTLLNEQIPEAQQRVTDLLDKYLKIHHIPKISEDWRDFDIGEFV